MANDPIPKPQEQPVTEKQTMEKQTVEKQPIAQQTGNKATTVNLKVTAGKGAPELVAGLHFPEGKAKTITVTPERAALLKRTTGYTVEEIK
jgi:hypothetical protein